MVALAASFVDIVGMFVGLDFFGTLIVEVAESQISGRYNDVEADSDMIAAPFVHHRI